MASIPYVVVPGMAHHVTQRGNRRQRAFFRDSDYEDYLLLLAIGKALWRTARALSLAARTSKCRSAK